MMGFSPARQRSGLYFSVAMFLAILNPVNQESRAAPPENSEAIRQTEPARYAGTWKVVAIEAGGKSTLDESRKIVVENKSDGSWTLFIDGSVSSTGSNTFDPLAIPKEIDIAFHTGNGAGTTLKGIYKLHDNMRKLCFRGGNAWRPRVFSGAAGTKSVLITFERQAVR